MFGILIGSIIWEERQKREQAEKQPDTFALGHDCPENMSVWLNGLLQQSGRDYRVEGNRIVLDTEKPKPRRGERWLRCGCCEEVKRIHARNLCSTCYSRKQRKGKFAKSSSTR